MLRDRADRDAGDGEVGRVEGEAERAVVVGRQDDGRAVGARAKFGDALRFPPERCRFAGLEAAPDDGDLCAECARAVELRRTGNFAAGWLDAEVGLPVDFFRRIGGVVGAGRIPCRRGFDIDLARHECLIPGPGNLRQARHDVADLGDRFVEVDLGHVPADDEGDDEEQEEGQPRGESILPPALL